MLRPQDTQDNVSRAERCPALPVRKANRPPTKPGSCRCLRLWVTSATAPAGSQLLPVTGRRQARAWGTARQFTMWTRLLATARRGARRPHCMGTTGLRLYEPEAGAGLHLGDERRHTARRGDPVTTWWHVISTRPTVGGPVIAVSRHTRSAWRLPFPSARLGHTAATRSQHVGQRGTHAASTRPGGLHEPGHSPQGASHVPPCPARLPLRLPPTFSGKPPPPIRRPALLARAQVTTPSGHHEASRSHQHFWRRPGSTHTAGGWEPRKAQQGPRRREGSRSGHDLTGTTGRTASEAAASMGPGWQRRGRLRPLRQEVMRRLLSWGDPCRPKNKRGGNRTCIPAPSPLDCLTASPLGRPSRSAAFRAEEAKAFPQGDWASAVRLS